VYIEAKSPEVQIVEPVFKTIFYFTISLKKSKLVFSLL
jgi:hypothetical protein